MILLKRNGKTCPYLGQENLKCSEVINFQDHHMVCFHWHWRSRLDEFNDHIDVTKEHLEGGSFLKSIFSKAL